LIPSVHSNFNGRNSLQKAVSQEAKRQKGERLAGRKWFINAKAEFFPPSSPPSPLLSGSSEFIVVGTSVEKKAK
jgi:hypothetical protein